MLLKNTSKSKTQYLDGTQATAVSARFSKVSSAIICSMLAILFLLTSANAHILAGVAFADGEEDGKKTIKDAADSYIPEAEEGEEDGQLFNTLDKFSNDNNKQDTTSFAYVLERMFTFNYLNNTEKAYTPSNVDKKDRQCEANDPNAGTLIYHNCDVPNIMTELTQDFVSTWSQQGAIGADTESATLDSARFGLPLGIPADGAPVDPSQRSVKYTGLEIYGYNLKYTDYNGEWDHIKVMTSARTMSNFGFMDDLKMGIHTITQGVTGGLQNSASGFIDGMSSGGFLGAIGGGFTGFFSGSAASSINSILDTSDHNVFSTYAWYRVGFGGTLYNARELTEAETASRYQNSMLEMILSNVGPANAEVPEEIQSLRNGLPVPQEAISKCTIKNAENQNQVVGSTTIAPGTTEEDCKLLAQHAYEVRETRGGNPANDKATFTWVVDGSQKKETLTEWLKNNQAMVNTAESNGMTCQLNTDETTRADNIAQYRLCWNTQYEVISSNARNEQQADSNTEWLMNTFNPSNIMGWFTKSGSENNPNAPWNRFVCVDSNGQDMLNDDGSLVKLYDLNGDLNPGCNPVRSPVQNGFFGNGYLPDQEKPGTDTRWVSPNSNLLNVVLPIKQISTSIGNAGLTIASFITRVSNTIISITFNPPLEFLGIDKIIVKMIESFRDSLFFPLIVLFIALAGIQIMWNVGRQKNYQTQAVSILMLCLTIFTGVILMFKPAQTVKAVDTIPSMIETAIMGSIFSAGNRTDDNLCHATGTISESSFINLEGQSFGVSAKEGTRVLMCENWRTFAFNPWVKGQWGADYSELYAANSNKENTMNNTNTALVGNAAVNMGGGYTENNWALYQLETTTSGTAYNRNLMDPSGRVDSDFYRIVDLQAGPNNGAGTDSRFFDTWSGNDYSRVLVGPLSAIVAIIGGITVSVYAIAKVQIAIVTTFMLLMIPIMFLFGIHPTQGRLKLKGYVGSIIGLMLQRVVLILLLAVLFRIITQLGSFSTNYFVGAIFTLVVCIFFLRARKDILRMVFEAVSTGFGQPVGQQFMDNPTQWANKNFRNKEASRGLLANTMERAKVGSVSFAGGAIGSFMASGAQGAAESIRKDATKAARENLSRLTRVQRHRGYGLAQTMVQAGRSGVEQVEKRNKENPYAIELREEALQKTEKYQKYTKDLETYNKIATKEEKGENPKTGKEESYKTYTDENGETVTMFKPEKPSLNRETLGKTLSNRKQALDIRNQNKLDKKMNRDKGALVDDLNNIDENKDYQQFYDMGELKTMRRNHKAALDEMKEELKVKEKELKQAVRNQERGNGKLSPEAMKIKDSIDELKQKIRDAENDHEDIINRRYSESILMRNQYEEETQEFKDKIEKNAEKARNAIAKQDDRITNRDQAWEDFSEQLKYLMSRTKSRKREEGEDV